MRRPGLSLTGLFLLLLALSPGIPASSPWQAPARTRAAILIFDGVQIIDYAGPLEVLYQADLEVFTVAASPGPITTAAGMRVIPSYTLAAAPAADVLVVPGGDVEGVLDNPAALAWVTRRAAAARYVLSVCNGAFILAKAGLLDGLAATTFHDLIPELRRAAPKTRVVADQRFVDNGKIVTTAGLSSGIDGTLRVVEKLLGKGKAQQVALNMEYRWEPDVPYARASFADLHLRRLFGRRLRLDVPGGGESRLLSTEGGTDRWQVRWELATATPLADLEAALARLLADRGRWTPRGAAAGFGLAREWTFTDAERRPWNAWVELQPLSRRRGEYAMSVRIERTGA
jgi:transcriptional regulator GlxA family with amidase domain